MHIFLELFMINYSSKKCVKENTTQIPEIKHNVMECRALTYFEV
jgi:hypothetical protein